jgi:nitrogen regulatory protein PII
MKDIRAYIKNSRLNHVCMALHAVQGVSGMTALDARGFGRPREHDHEQADDAFDFHPCTRIEIVCDDESVEEIISTIRSSAHTGLRGDGKIFVFSVEQAVRISTGERGDEVIRDRTE